MIERIPDLPDNVLGFAATGTVTASDYETSLMPAVEALFARQGKARFLYHLGDRFSGFAAGAMWDDAKLGLRHFTGWERVAIVSDVEWLRAAMKVFALAMPGQVRAFYNCELDEAKRWVSE
jgi:hypothetical protein